MQYKTTDNSLQDVCYLLDRFISESKFDVKVHPQKVARFVNKSDYLTVVVYHEEVPIAIIMACTYSQPLFDVTFSDDFLIYVVPEFRGGTISVRLIKLYEEWAKQRGVDYILVSQATGTGNVERVRKFYEKLGFSTTGYNAMKRV